MGVCLAYDALSPVVEFFVKILARARDGVVPWLAYAKFRRQHSKQID